MNGILLPSGARDGVIPAFRYQPATPYHTIVISSREAFDALADEWNALLATSGVENGFLRHEWLSTWLEYFPSHRPCVILVRNHHGEMVAAAPFSVQRAETGLFRRVLRHVQFIGTELSIYDWMSLPVAADADETAVLSAIAKALLVLQSQWDVLELHYCMETRQLEILKGALEHETDRSVIFESSRMPFIALPDDCESFRSARRDKKLKKSVNAGRNRLQTDGRDLRLEFRTPSAETDAMLDRFFKRHIEYWTGRGRPSNFLRFPQLARFYKEVFRRSQHGSNADVPQMIFSVLMTGHTEMSYQLGFRQGDVYLDYIDSYREEARHYSPGILHKEELMFESIRRGARTYSFGRGLEAYKDCWTRHSDPLWSLRVYKNAFSFHICQSDVRLKKLLGRPAGL